MTEQPAKSPDSKGPKIVPPDPAATVPEGIADVLPGKPGAHETEEQARARAERCGLAITEVLRDHRCRIVPYLLPIEPVGRAGSKGVIEAAFGIVPEEPT